MCLVEWSVSICLVLLRFYCFVFFFHWFRLLLAWRWIIICCFRFCLFFFFHVLIQYCNCCVVMDLVRLVNVYLMFMLLVSFSSYFMQAILSPIPHVRRTYDELTIHSRDICLSNPPIWSIVLALFYIHISIIPFKRIISYFQLYLLVISTLRIGLFWCVISISSMNSVIVLLYRYDVYPYWGCCWVWFPNVPHHHWTICGC